MSAETKPVLLEAPILFEAIVAPPRSLSRRGTAVLTAGVLLASLTVGTVFLLLGAWPVLGFAGLEAVLVLGLLRLHQRWSERTLEVVRLTEAGLTIRRTDRRGQLTEIALDPYWSRLRLEERPGKVSLLLLQQRDRKIEIGKVLGEEQKRDLAAALRAALRHWREPVFDNPQLRDG